MPDTRPPNDETRQMNALLVRQDNDGIAVLTLNRPEKYNALSGALMTEIETALAEIAGDPAIRVVILKGAGKVFCAGHDLAEMKTITDRGALRRFFDQCSRMMLAFTQLPQPVIAQVHGMATAAGCQLVAQCDLAVAAETARFATSGVNLGLFCSTPMVAVTRNLPRKQAMEMLLTGEFIDADTARAHGLVNQVVPDADLSDTARALADRIRGQSPTAIAFGKELFYRQISEGIESAYELASETITANMLAPDAQDGVQAFLEKSPLPQWPDRQPAALPQDIGEDGDGEAS